MTDLEELHDQLDTLSHRGTVRPSQEVLDAARRSIVPAPRRRGLVVVPIAAAIVLLASAAGWYLATRDDSVAVTTGGQPQLVDSLSVPAVGEVRQVAVRVDRIWVASMRDGWPPVTTIQVFDARTGDAIGEVEAPGPNRPDLVGDVLAIAATDHALWVRTTTSGPAIPEYGGADNVIFRIDPATLAAQPVRFLQGDGPLVADRDRIVAADFSHLEIVGDDGTELADRSIDQVLGIEGANLPGTNGISALHLDADGLWAVHDGRRLIARLDPDSGELIASGGLGDGDGDSPLGRSVRWVTVLNFSGRPPLAIGIALDDPGAWALPADMPLGRNLVASIDSERFLVDNPVAVVDAATGQVTPLDDRGSRATVVSSGEAPRVAMWSPGEGDTVITFLAVPN